MPRTRPTLLALSAALACTLAAAPTAQADRGGGHGAPDGGRGGTVRFATFNASLNRPYQGTLVEDLSDPGDEQAQAAAEVVQRTRPDVLLVNEFDYDEQGRAAALFQRNYLARAQNGAEPIRYRYRYTAPVNTGVASGFDLDNDGRAVTEPGAPGYAGDAYGFGAFPGQYGMVVYSRYPIDRGAVRTFQTFRWADMPGALLPTDPETGEDYYSEQERAKLRLSSKSHWDVPVRLGRGRPVHLLASHPTPPSFDGPEKRNVTRNHDENRFFADYVSPHRSGYIYDDEGRRGGLPPGARFVIAGDLNADPEDGDGHPRAVLQLLESDRVEGGVRPTSEGAPQAAREQGGANAEHTGDPALDTADFGEPEPGNLRVDYVLPSRGLPVADTRVFWPAEGRPGAEAAAKASDHHLVWLDVCCR
ncbi:endonuclease/exonuclease/phosphatase family protein [Streptomonospora wellingtoniae]|uniref:Endonuclease/exonuclease/phosphatase family protein n=1 Tax=Streptomonospora wellingtoniae TaxID=3075544 RepID=A0ABU2KPX1_9ACTN|nr:endonuclease/exonuclease/phosphatase family protein [Streptomonospora sp. DSM 45055]MDT0301178.1 endonuclease/exonuclease/phosphatase family protein [Streptomonospora sp. DSM 45055]